MSLLDVHGLSVSYGGVHANREVDLQVPEGALVGLIGPNGAGKTTFLDALTGFTAPTAGTIRFDDRDVTTLPAHQRARAGLVRTFQSLELFEDLSVGDNLLAAAHDPDWLDVLRDVVRPRRALVREGTVADALDAVGLGDVAGRLPSDLSHGQRIRVGVARALAMQPRLLLLDEPAAGLDAAESRAFGDNLRALVDAGRFSAVLVDHDMALVFRVCDVVHVLDFGRVIASGTPDEVRRDHRVLEAYLGSAADDLDELPAPSEGDDG